MLLPRLGPTRRSADGCCLHGGAALTLAQGRIRISAGLPHAATLTKELADYQVKISASGHDSYSAREDEHDDLVYSLCQLVWYRDWYSANYDDALARGSRQGAGV